MNAEQYVLSNKSKQNLCTNKFFYSTSQQGRIGELKVTQHLTYHGYMVCKPEIDEYGIDLVISPPKLYKKNQYGSFKRFITVQVKYNRKFYPTKNGYNLRIHVKKNTLADYIACPIDRNVLDNKEHVMFYKNTIYNKRYIKEFGFTHNNHVMKSEYKNQHKRKMLVDYLKLPT
jgi:hypothetical protein